MGLVYPLYRLHAYGEAHFVVDVIPEDGPDTEAAGYVEEDDWTHCPKTRLLAAVTTREAALAVLRLHGAEAFQDWTPEGLRLGWSSPLTEMPKAVAA